MIEELKKNIENEKKIIADVNSLYSHIQNSGESAGIYSSSLKSLLYELKILNDAVPGMLKSISPYRSLEPASQRKKTSDIVTLSYTSPSSGDKRYVSLNKKDKQRFLDELKISSAGLKNITRTSQKIKTKTSSSPNFILKTSNKLFLKLSEKLVPHFKDIGEDLKKANMKILLSTYISTAIFSSLISFVLSLAVFSVLIALNLSYVRFFWVPLIVPLFTLAIFYLYPSSERNSVRKKITQEMPFATIHMAAISGSDIEPTKIFKIIAESSEYPNIGAEIKKVIVQTDIYGYDLVTSLKNASRQTSNKKLAELFSGIAINISSGGSLKDYLEKKAENFLLDYKLERESYSNLAGTFMDIYISILIAAPLVLMMMFIVMNIANMGLSLGIETLLFLSIGGVVLLNIIFLIVLQIKQPAM